MMVRLLAVSTLTLPVVEPSNFPPTVTVPRRVDDVDSIDSITVVEGAALRDTGQPCSTAREWERCQRLKRALSW